MAVLAASEDTGSGMTTQAWLWTADGLALALAVVTGLAEARRHRRATLDRPGWMPWRGLQVVAFFAVVTIAVFAVRAG